MSEYDIVVIGAGCAGMTAAIYVKRANLSVLMIEKSAPGGQINQTAHIENYPGTGLIDGPSLSMKMFEQTQNLGIPYKYGDVLEIKDLADKKLVVTDQEQIMARAVIIATGRKPKSLGLDNEIKLTGRGISWCAVCDGPLYKEKNVLVIGGGNSAVEEALYLKDIVNSVTIVHRREEFRADKEVSYKVMHEPKITIKWNTTVTKFNEVEGKLDSVELEDVITKEKQILKTDGAFIYIGSVPVTGMLKNYNIVLNEEGYVLVDENNKTLERGIYAAGDCTKKELYQIATAVGDGAKAAISAIKDLS